jgi:hypothetical protein
MSPTPRPGIIRAVREKNSPRPFWRPNLSARRADISDMKLSTPAVVLVALVASAGCKKSNSANSPLNPGSSPLPGVWTGTLTRPGGLAPFSVRWDTGLDGYSMNGVMTLSSGNVSATTTGQGNVAGNDSKGYTIFLSLSSAGPGCTVRGSSDGPTEGQPFPQPFKTISIPVFSISYLQCQDLLGSNTPFLEEKVQLNLTKP